MQSKFEEIDLEYQEKIDQAESLVRLDEIYLELFGKNGQVTLLPKEFSSLPKEELKNIGPAFNQLKSKLELSIKSARTQKRQQIYAKLEGETLDLVGVEEKIKERQGHIHPLTEFENHIVKVFSEIGFQQYDASQIDTDINNFQVLNMPEDHPARDLQDTFYIEQQSGDFAKLLLRTHTSNSQIHMMEELELPIRMVNIGRAFRNEAVDARHEHTFNQFELFYIDKDLSLANLLYLSEYFLKAVFGPKIQARLRPKYYPFVEPGAGIDGLCIFCDGKGCKICGGVGWLELGGAGMIHPNVLKAGGIDPKIYSGIAWGCSPERMVMLKYGIADMRELRSGNLKIYEKVSEK